MSYSQPFQVISEQHPKSLLILDDVWSFDVAQAFAVRCRTMVTSRNASVANGVLTPQIYSVSVSEGTVAPCSNYMYIQNICMHNSTI